jgi:hypothetical protein
MIFTSGLGRTLSSKALSIAFAIGSLASASFAQQAKVLAPHRPIPPKAAKQIPGLTPVTQRSMFGGLWMTDANFKSSIYLRNSVETDPITVTPVLHLSNGSKYTLADVKVEPAGIAIIDINAGLSKLDISPVATLSGYVELQYLWGWDPFCATIRNIDTVHSLIFNYALRPTAPPPIMVHAVHPKPTTPAQAVEGLWWKQEGNVTGFVSVANLSGTPAQTIVQVTDDRGKPIAQHNVTVSPQGMKLISLVELQTTSALRGGIRVTSTTTMDNLVVNGGLEDQAVGYSANLPFSSELVRWAQATPTQMTIAELGLMTGAADPMMFFPGGTTFTPYSLLRNVSNSPISLTPTLWWMEAGIPRSAQLPTVTLAPWRTQSLDMRSLLSASGLKNFNGSFNLAFEGQLKAGSLIMTSGSVDQTNSYVFEVVPRFVGESASKSLQYWSTGNGDDTMVTIWNPADEAQDFAYTFFFSGGHYTLPLHLEPRATRSFNVSEIIQSQVPDAEGNIIPPSIHEGGAKIAGSIAENQHILVAVDSGTYNVRKATCSNNCQECDGYTSAQLADNPFAIGVGGTHQQNLSLTYGSGTQYNFNGNATWSSSNTSMATVAAGLIRGVSAGSPTINAVVYNVPLQEGYICTGPNSCPTSTFAESSPGTVKPVITLISPDWGKAGTNNIPVTIKGSGFGTAASAQASGTGITINVSQPTQDGQINATFSIQTGTAQGAQGVTVTNTTVNTASAPQNFYVTTQGCPSSASTSLTDTLSLSSVFPNLLTGIGNVARVTVGPTSSNWNGLPIEELISDGPSNTCGVDICLLGSEQASLFTIGSGYQPAVVEGGSVVDVGPLLVGTTDEFFDQYTIVSPQDFLGQKGLNSCAAACSQQYVNVCGQTIFSHNFTFTLTHSTMGASNTPVTLVTASE